MMSRKTAFPFVAVLLCALLQASAVYPAKNSGGRLLLQAGRTAGAQSGDNRLSPDNAALLIVDHQTGLLELVRDWEVATFKTNVLGLAQTGKLFNLPVVLTTSREDGPNGPLLPEIKKMFPNAPYIARPGEINAWDNAEFRQAVKVRIYWMECIYGKMSLIGPP